jgi:hypothetical protein
MPIGPVELHALRMHWRFNKAEAWRALVIATRRDKRELSDAKLSNARAASFDRARWRGLRQSWRTRASATSLTTALGWICNSAGFRLARHAPRFKDFRMQQDARASHLQNDPLSCRRKCDQ